MKTARPISELHVIGGHPALDFVNTADVTFEYLSSYDALAAWGRHVGLLSEAERRLLALEARRRPADAARAYERALDLRAALGRVFGSLARGRGPHARDLEELRDFTARAVASAKLAPVDGGFSWHWRDDDLERVLSAVSRAAAALLTSPDLARLKACPGGGCGWLFLDRSKNRSRRWCAMEHCGTTEKARRYVARRAARRAGSGAGASAPPPRRAPSG